MTLRFAYIVPEDLAKKTVYPEKVYSQAKLLSKFGQVTLFGYNVKPEKEYHLVDLNKISEHSNSLRKSFSVYRKLIFTILYSKYDYVFIPTIFHPLMPFLFFSSKISRKKVIYDVRDSLHFTMIKMKKQVRKRSGNIISTYITLKFSSILDKMLIRLSNFALASSPSLYKYLISNGKKPNKSAFQYNNNLPVTPIDVTINDLPQKIQSAINSKKIVVFSFGHIQPEIRGIEMILNALSSAQNKNILLVLFGEIQDREYWNEFVQSLNCKEEVIFLNPKPKNEAMGTIRLFDYMIIGPHAGNVLPAKIFDCINAGNTLIFPENMKDLSMILQKDWIQYKDENNLKTIFTNLAKPHRENQSNRDFPSMETMLKSAFQIIFEKN